MRDQESKGSQPESYSRDVIRQRLELMRQEALDYQIEHQGKDDSHNAMMGD